jgi:hypothetical protein
MVGIAKKRSMGWASGGAASGEGGSLVLT